MCVPLGGLFVFSFSALFGIIIDVVNQGIHNEVSMERIHGQIYSASGRR